MIRALRETDAEEYAALRREALLDSPLAFAASPGDDVASSPDAVREQIRRGPESVIFGAFREGLVGALGLYRDRHQKASHKVHLWGTYVRPGHRREGLAAALLEAALRHATTLPGVEWAHLSVSSEAPAARRLYERLGFRIWGDEPDALRYQARTAVEHHMLLRLPAAGC